MKVSVTDELFSYAVEIRRDLHRHPEIGFDLPRTANLVTEELKKMGYEPTHAYGTCSVVAEVGQGEEVLAIRADMDAVRHLPDILNGLPKTAVLCGASRKRVIAHAAGGDDPDRLAGTLALHTAAQLRGATVLRVHDVKEAVQAAAVIDTFMNKKEF